MDINKLEPMEHDEVVSHIKEKIKEKRIPQKELADKVGIKEVTMSRYLNFKRTMPFDVMSKCLAEVGCAFVVINLVGHSLEMKEDV